MLPSVSIAPSVLLVEAEPTILKVCQKLFQRKGYPLDTASSLSEARAHLSKVPKHSFLVTDLRFSDGDGFQFMRIFRRLNPKAKILVMSDLTTMESQVLALNLKVEEYIAKPFEIEEFWIAFQRLGFKNNALSPQRGRVFWVASCNEETLRLGSQCLALAGFACEAATSPLEAEEKIWKKISAGDLVIADLTLGETEVFNLCRRIRDSLPFANIPVILLAQINEPAQRPDHILTQAQQAGARLLLTKPQKPYDLVHRVEKFLGNALCL